MKEIEYFIVSNSFAAPFFSDTATSYIKGKNAEAAMNDFVKKYSHPAGLFAAIIYRNSDDYHKGNKPLGKWLCNQEIKKQNITKRLKSYVYKGNRVGDFEIDGKRYIIKKPKSGKYFKDVPCG